MKRGREMEKKQRQLRMIIACRDSAQRAVIAGRWRTFKELCIAKGMDPVDRLSEMLEEAVTEMERRVKKARR